MKIFVYDEFNPEDIAMMQALYSRSAESVTNHVEKVRQSGSGKFMEKFYVGYGHASIADCGSTTIFIEGVSMLVAKAIEDWPLFSGQETSSRYIDMSKQEIIDPLGTPLSRRVLANWMRFYIESQEPVLAHLRLKYPKKANEDEGVYERALKARVFDILRGFLPAGVTTQLSWHSNLRQAHDKLALLRYWPLPEGQAVAGSIRKKLQDKYAHSFGHKEYPAQEAYRALLGKEATYYLAKKFDGKFKFTTRLKPSDLAPYRQLLAARPEKTNLPLFLAELGMLTFDFPLDFGSFRDIHRHRNGVCRMPLLTTKFGFHDWYLAQLPSDLQLKAKRLIAEQKSAIAKLTAKSSKPASPSGRLEAQYYIAMGFNVACRVSYGLPATIYTIELRSGRLVHPTLRAVAHQMARALGKKFLLLKLHADLSLDDWDIRRGLQDIKEKARVG